MCETKIVILYSVFGLSFTDVLINIFLDFATGVYSLPVLMGSCSCECDHQPGKLARKLFSKPL